MIAAWMLFALVTGGALTLGAAATERLAVAARRPRRFVWLAALGATAIWPTVAGLAALAADAFPSNDAVAVTRGTYRLPALVVPTFDGAAARSLDVALLGAWGLGSAVLLARLAASGYMLRRWRRAWPAVDVDGVRVRVSPDAGPAVVGLRAMEVVLPAWALALDHSLRALVLRHEAEHQAARDPYVLWFAAILTALVPWHVALWWQARRLRLAVEIDCDARVLRADPRPARYARLLLVIAHRRSTASRRLAPAQLGLSARASDLERRITAMRPTTRPASRLQPITCGVAALATVAVACAVQSPDWPVGPHATDQAGASRADARRSASPAASAGTGATAEFREFTIDTPAVLLGNPGVRYPDALRAAGITGEVLAQLVVDKTGSVDPRTLKVLRSTHPAFTAAVEAALPTWRFRPARVGSHTVKQLVQLPIQFAPPR